MSQNAAPFMVLLLNGVTSGASIPQLVLPYRDLSIYLIGSGTISAGTLIVEEAAYDPYGEFFKGSTMAQSVQTAPATWSAVTGSAPLDCTEVSGGAQKAYQLPPGSYAWVRARIGTSISGSGGKIYAILTGV